MKVKSLKPLRYGSLFIPQGTIGIIVDTNYRNPFSNTYYDYNVSFDGHRPIGVFKDEVEIVKETNKNE